MNRFSLNLQVCFLYFCKPGVEKKKKKDGRWWRKWLIQTVKLKQFSLALWIFPSINLHLTQRVSNFMIPKVVLDQIKLEKERGSGNIPWGWHTHVWVFSPLRELKTHCLLGESVWSRWEALFCCWSTVWPTSLPMTSTRTPTLPFWGHFTRYL